MKSFLLILVLVILCLPLMALVPNDPGLPGGDPDQPVPIDGAMYILMAAGILFGLRSIKRSR